MSPEQRITNIIMRNPGKDLSEADKKEIDEIAKEVAMAGLKFVLEASKKSA